MDIYLFFLLRKVRQDSLGESFGPIGNGLCFDPFIFTGEIYGYAKFGGGLTFLKDGFENLIVSVRRFNKDLCASDLS